MDLGPIHIRDASAILMGAGGLVSALLVSAERWAPARLRTGLRLDKLKPTGAAVPLGVAAILVILEAAATSDGDGWTSQTVAAWVQAFGSVAAIVGAAWIAGNQARREAARRASERREAERGRAREAIEFLTMLEAVGSHASATAKQLPPSLKNDKGLTGAYFAIYAPLFADLRNDLDSLIGLQAPGTGGRMIATNLRGLVGNLRFTLQAPDTGLKLGHRMDESSLSMICEALEETAAKIDEQIALAVKMRQAADRADAGHPGA